jgi:hypothetical protein
MATTYSSEKSVDQAKIRRAVGEALIDVSAEVYTGYIELFSIVVPAGQAHQDVTVFLDLAKATTGFAAVNTAETVQFCLQSKVDGTNARNLVGGSFESTAISGTNAASRGQVLMVGTLKAGTHKVMVKLSAETGGDCRIPFEVVSRGLSDLTCTPLYA